MHACNSKSRPHAITRSFCHHQETLLSHEKGELILIGKKSAKLKVFNAAFAFNKTFAFTYAKKLCAEITTDFSHHQLHKK